MIKLPKFNIVRSSCGGKYLCRASFILMVLSILTQIVITNKLSLRGNELVELASRKAQLQKDLSKLELDDSRLSSLAYLEETAKKLGFVIMTDTLYSIDAVSGSSVAVLTPY